MMKRNITLLELYLLCINDDVECDVIVHHDKWITLSTDTLTNIYKQGNQKLLNSEVKWFRFNFNDDELILTVCLECYEEWMKDIKTKEK